MRKPLLIFVSIFILTTAISQNKSTLFKSNFSIKPFNVNSVGLGIGMNYERYIDKTNNFSLVFPLDFSFELASGVYNLNENSTPFGINFNPGFRFYFVEPSNFNWYLGTSFLFGHEFFSYMDYDPLGRPIGEQSATRNKFGTLVNIGFKGTIKERFTYGVELGNGIKFLDKTSSNSIYYSSSNSRYMGSLAVGFGYNF